MLGRLICWWKGKHKRGKRLYAMNDNDANGQRLASSTGRYYCPRCGAEWTRKVK